MTGFLDLLEVTPGLNHPIDVNSVNVMVDWYVMKMMTVHAVMQRVIVVKILVEW